MKLLEIDCSGSLPSPPRLVQEVRLHERQEIAPSGKPDRWRLVFRRVSHDGVVLALLGASASLSGLLLVFLGFVVAVYGGLSDDGTDDARTKLGRAAFGLLIAFIIGLVCVATSTAWLVGFSHNQPLYDATVSFFALQLVGLTAATIWTLKELLWTHRHRVAKNPRSSGVPTR
jgi:hypothetical protein